MPSKPHPGGELNTLTLARRVCMGKKSVFLNQTLEHTSFAITKIQIYGSKWAFFNHIVQESLLSLFGAIPANFEKHGYYELKNLHASLQAV